MSDGDPGRPRGELADQPLTREGPAIRSFTAAQRRALVGVLTIFLVILSVLVIRNPAHVPDPMPDRPPRYEELADRLDPNTSDAASLSALPQLGARRANDIVEYRERMRAGDPDRVVFRTLQDLLRVRGIGSAMIKHLEPYLSFPATRPSTSATVPAALE